MNADDLALKSLMDWWADMGVDAPPPPKSANRAAREAPRLAAAAPEQAAAKAPPAPRPIARVADDPVGAARKLAGSATTLKDLRQKVAAFEGCALKAGARNTVFADGAPEADIMIVGEAPGRDEDAKGLPFVGRSGKLMDKMFAAIGLDRTRNLYIANILPWRPPGNRNPDAGEIAICLPFVERQIELVRPKLLITAGKFAAHSLLRTQAGVMSLRGRKMLYSADGLTDQTPCIPILHPAYLLRRPQDKSKAWSDMLTIAQMADELGAKRDAGV